MEFGDAVRLLTLAVPLFKHRLKVYHAESGKTFEVDSITVFNSPEGDPEIHIEI